MDRLRRICFSPPFIALASIVTIFCGLKYYAPQYLIHHSEEIENQVWALKQQIDSLQRDIGRLHREVGTNHLIERSNNSYPQTKPRSEGNRLRILVTGGTGFVGSHLVDKLMSDGHEVIALDNYFTGRKKNIERWIGHPNFLSFRFSQYNDQYSMF
jgi:FlaA1/EpsC-like NDP-sugar epimerase